MRHLSRENLFRGANNFGAFCCHSRNTGASPFSVTKSVLGSFMCITQHTGPTVLRPIRRTKQLWLSVLLKDTIAATGQAGIRTHIPTTPELESNARDRSATSSWWISSNCGLSFTGNEARHFTLKNNTAANIADGEAPTAQPPTTTFYANGTAFITCDSIPHIGKFTDK